MLLAYIDAAMHLATYEMIEDDNSYYGEIPECQGVWANAKTLEACREELISALEDWMLYRISKNLPLPVINGMDLSIKPDAIAA